MNAASTVEMASVVEPKTFASRRTQAISYTRPAAPERKKTARRIARDRGGRGGLSGIGPRIDSRPENGEAAARALARQGCRADPADWPRTERRVPAARRLQRLRHPVGRHL